MFGIWTTIIYVAQGTASENFRCQAALQLNATPHRLARWYQTNVRISLKLQPSTLIHTPRNQHDHSHSARIATSVVQDPLPISFFYNRLSDVHQLALLYRAFGVRPLPVCLLSRNFKTRISIPHHRTALRPTNPYKYPCRYLAFASAQVQP
ncbi:hypothetical protein M422DRAFT_786148 [Sphaerobolus stellatus SS14]|uniref:Uncharacterized protein n=1 Tax=Sphaerobolus stellatus (strain SS14) TaxID=990650 RepID=A0A0C9T3T6_SPHS4|nr:hypothetical protein M422DRAFT_786148 [Sphaerobolus stellatus SS14]